MNRKEREDLISSSENALNALKACSSLRNQSIHYKQFERLLEGFKSLSQHMELAEERLRETRRVNNSAKYILKSALNLTDSDF